MDDETRGYERSSYTIECHGNITCHHASIASMTRHKIDFCAGSVSFQYAMLPDFRLVPRKIAGKVDLTGNKITSLKGVHKELTHCRTLDLSYNHIKEGGIGLLLIVGLKGIKYNEDSPTAHGTSTRAFQALAIINRYLGQGSIDDNGQQFLLECANELDEAGLHEFGVL